MDPKEEKKNNKVKYEKTDEKLEVSQKEEMPKSISFVQHTADIMLSKELRRLIQELKSRTKLSINVLERAVDRIKDLLHKSNTWKAVTT